MGIFGKIFKGIGKVFKKIGKGIMKGFKAIGKFANKMGIFGQIGMMLLTGGIANAAFGAMSTMGAGFMQGLSQSTNVIGKMAYTALTGIKTVVSAPLKMASSVFKNVTKGAFQAIKDVGSHMSNKMFGTTLNTTSTGSLWDSLGKVGSKYGGNIAKDTSAAFGDVGNFLKDTTSGKLNIFKRNVEIPAEFRNFKTFDGVTKNISYNTSAAEQFEGAKNVFTDDLKYKQAMSGQANMGNKPSFIETQNKITDFGTPKPVDSMLARAKAGAVGGLKSSFSTSGLATTGGTALAQQVYGSSMATNAPADTSLAIQPTRNIFGMNLQKSVASTPTQFFNNFISNPQETFNTPDFQPTNYNQWMTNASNYSSSSYV